MSLIKIIPAVRSDSEFSEAILTDCNLLFDLNPDLLTLKSKVDAVHRAGKKLYIHFDLATGIGKDKTGMLYVKAVGVDGIISTRVNIIKLAREIGLFTVQRFFIVDSHSIDTTVEAVKSAKPDMIEIMPGIVAKVITDLKQRINTPIIAGGLIETSDEVESIIQSGATAVSIGSKALWSL
ncbi:MAG: glycerol-3-phosphate responsive antiterminator [Clostridia bacterium]|nr:glycerol-3-phosphate responsive antiterminator [Clostridia bacterium]